MAKRQARSVLRGDEVRVNLAEKPSDRAKHRWLKVTATERHTVGPEEDPEELVVLTCGEREFTVTADCEMELR